MIISGGEQIHIERANHFSRLAPDDTYVIYRASGVKNLRSHTCGANDLVNLSQQLQNTGAFRNIGNAPCYRGSVAIAVDSEYNAIHTPNTATEVTNLFNMVEAVLSSNSIGIEHQLSEIYISTVANELYGTVSNSGNGYNPNEMLTNFANWGNAGGFANDFDIGSLYTGRDLQADIVGIAFIGGVCNTGKYNINQITFSNTYHTWIHSHEIAHNWGAVHDGDGNAAPSTGFIMAPIVAINDPSPPTTFSSVSLTDIDNFKTASGGCVQAIPCTDGEFVASQTAICVGESVDFFTNSSKTSWNWTFTGGTPSSSTLQNPENITCNSIGIYDVSLRSNPGAVVSTQSNLIEVGNLPLSACTPTSQNTSSGNAYGIFRVQLHTLDKSTSGSFGDGGYLDLSCTELVELAPSTAYNITITHGSNTESVAVFIDFNNNGVLNDAGELVFSGNDQTSHTGVINTPASPVMNTRLRMRVLSEFSGFVTDPCNNPFFGQGEDYGVQFGAACTESLNCPTNRIVSNDAGNCTSIQSYIVTTNSCPGSTLTQTSGLGSGAAFPVGVTTKAYQLVDQAGSTSFCSFSITVNDTEDPVINCPASINQSNDVGQCGAVITFTVTSSDNCPGVANSQSTGLASASLFPVGTTSNLFRATDASGNIVTCTFNVTINDTENPVVSCPASIIRSNDSGQCGAVVSYSVSASDNCPGVVSSRSSGLASASQFPIGTSSIAYLATDASGNQLTCTFDVTINDAEAPVVTCPSDTLACATIVNYSLPMFTDNCPAVNLTRLSGIGTGGAFPRDTTTETYRISDASGNSVDCTFDVVVAFNMTETEAKIGADSRSFTGLLKQKMNFGSAVVPIGDLNGDGYVDIAVGAPKASPIHSVKLKKINSAGAIWVLMLNSTGDVIAHQKISADSGGVDPLLFDKKYQTGRALAYGGDLDNDGIGDLIVGQPGYVYVNPSNKKIQEAGAVLFLYMNADGTVKTHKRITTGESGFTGPLDKKFLFGSSLAVLPDLDGDGNEELLVGAIGDNHTPNRKKLSKAGGLWLLYLDTNQNVKSYNRWVNDTLGMPANTILKGEHFATSLATLGDIDGDGTQEIAVGSFKGNSVSPVDGKLIKRSGSVRLISISTDGLVSSVSLLADSGSGFTTELGANDLFGMALAPAGDDNEDGINDLIAGAPGDDDGDKERGAFYILHLNTNGGVVSHSKVSDTLPKNNSILDKKDFFGSAIATVVEDCFSLVFSGTIGDDGAKKDEGALWINLTGAYGDFVSAQGPDTPIVADLFKTNIVENQQMLSRQTDEFELFLAPNPASDWLSFGFSSGLDRNVSIQLLNISGQHLESLVANQLFNAGTHRLGFNLSSYHSGIYLVRAEIDGSTRVMRLVIQ